MYRKMLAALLALTVCTSVCLENSWAKPGSSRSSSFGSSRSSSFGSSRSSSFGSSRPKYSSPSSSSSSKPKYSSPSSSSSSKPKYSSPSSSGSSTSSKPKYSSPSSGGSTAKPSTFSGSSKERAAAQQSSKKAYVQTKAATAPPKPTYTSPAGKTVNVRTQSSTVQTIRNRPSSYYTPEQRTQRTEVHVHTYGYSHPYDWYYGQPSFYVGGGYSSAFWWMMSEWSAERRARWLYHNQNVIEREAYERGMKDAAVAAELARLQTEGVQPNPDYVDDEFKENPDLMYEQEYVEAAYNPVVVETRPQGSALRTVFVWIIILGVCGFLAYLLFFKIRWGN